jgi:hypothetical protein
MRHLASFCTVLAAYSYISNLKISAILGMLYYIARR